MIIEITKHTLKDKNNHTYHKKVVELKCDHCGCEFSKKYAIALTTQQTHACSSTCSNRCEKKKQINAETCMIKFGSKFAMKNVDIKEKHRKTLNEKYGVDFSYQIPKCIESSHSKETIYKQHLTKIKNGTCKKSYLETELQESLAKITPIKPQQLINKKYSIDISIPTFNCLIQFDGAHWHRLDQPLNYIPKSKHEEQVLKKFYRDRDLDKYIVSNSLRLIRVTDITYKNNRLLTLNTILDLLNDKNWIGVKYLGKHFTDCNFTDQIFDA